MKLFANVGLMGDITHRHHDTGLVLTYQIVPHPIYCICTSSALQVSAGGYLPFGIIPSDNRLLWLKIGFDSAFGAKMDTLLPHTARRLKFQKTDTVKCFIELYKNFIRDNVQHSDIFSLQESLLHEPFTTPPF